MDAFIPKDWIPISKRDFKTVLAVVDYWRDWWSNGITYHTRHNNKAFAFQFNNGQARIDPNFQK